MPFSSGPVRGRPRRMSRLVRWLAGRNTLRRPVDRIEGTVLMALTAAFVAAIAVASVVGVHTYQSQRAASAGLRPVVATLSQTAPLLYDSLVQRGQAKARWHDPGGGEKSGVLTIWTVPGILGAAAGAQIPVWLNRSGQPAGASRRPGRPGRQRAGRKRRGGRAGWAGLAQLLCAVPAYARPAAADGMGVRMVPDRTPVDHPPLTSEAAGSHRAGQPPAI